MSFFRRGIHVLPERWEKVVSSDGQYLNWNVFVPYILNKFPILKKKARTYLRTHYFLCIGFLKSRVELLYKVIKWNAIEELELLHVFPWCKKQLSFIYNKQIQKAKDKKVRKFTKRAKNGNWNEVSWKRTRFLCRKTDKNLNKINFLHFIGTGYRWLLMKWWNVFLLSKQFCAIVVARNVSERRIFKIIASKRDDVTNNYWKTRNILLKLVN